MDKDKSPGIGHGGGAGLPPPSSTVSSSSSAAVAVAAGSTMSRYAPFTSPQSSSSSSHFSYDISRMSDIPARNTGHRRAHSEILSLPDDISFDSDLGVVGGAADGPSLSDEADEDLFSMYIDMEKFGSSSATSGPPFPDSSAAVDSSGGGAMSTMTSSQFPTLHVDNATSGLGSSSERPRARHQHSQSMDGSTSIKIELLGSDSPSLVDNKKALSAAKLADLALVDPKRAKRIWANRQSAARSKERKMRYISELERKVQTLQTEATTLSAQLTMLQRDATGLTAENSELKLRLQTMEQQVHLQDALNEALREEVNRLKLMTGQVIPNGGPVLNYGSSSFSGNQQYYPPNHAMQSLLAAHQLQQLHIHSQQQLIPNQHHHQQSPQAGELRPKAPVSSSNQSQQESLSKMSTAPGKN